MLNETFISPDLIRAEFASAMSEMYQAEVPLYGDLITLVTDVNCETLEKDSKLRIQLENTHELERLDEERHGAIRLGTAEELYMMRRLFAVMGMMPVGYYDLTTAGVPVHSTAFRAVHESSLRVSPFRVFTSLLRLELIEDESLRQEAEKILAKREIFSDEAVRLINQYESEGGLTAEDADLFVKEVLKTFGWHADATVTNEQYQKLHDQHRLIADVVAFKGPHINHLTPRTLDIDEVQHLMPTRGITAKAIIEGPPTRKCPILLRQTSFKALSEEILFKGEPGNEDERKGYHTARFGEIEQRGVALTPKGRKLYDQLLTEVRAEMGESPNETNSERYYEVLSKIFSDFPDSYEELHDQGLAYFSYYPTEHGLKKAGNYGKDTALSVLIAEGAIDYEPIVYEDFLPVSAAGIFQSNLGGDAQVEYHVEPNQVQFESALGAKVQNELELYAQSSARSLEDAKKSLKIL